MKENQESSFRFGTVIAIFSPVLLCLLVVASRINRSGSFFGLDFNLYQPDGRFYLWETYRLLGKSDGQAWNLVTHFYENLHLVSTHYISKISPVNDVGLRKDIQMRPLYPLISSPFVKVFGPAGLLVVPILSFISCCYLVILSFAEYRKRVCAVIGFGLLTSSPFFIRGFITNYSDALLSLLIFLAYYLLRKERGSFWLIFVISFAGEVTRPSEPLWIVICILFFFTTRKGRYLFLASLHTLFLGAVSILSPDSTGLSTRNGYGILNRVLDLVPHALKIIGTDLAEILVLDRILFAMIAIFLILIIKTIRKKIDRSAFYILCATVSMSVWNGAVGTGWRYELPALCPVLVSLLDMTSDRNNLIKFSRHSETCTD